MALDVTHPQYNAMLPDWETVRDVYKGERHVKEKGAVYLPPTQSMIIDGYGVTTGRAPTLGQANYNAYLTRAVLPDYVEDAVEVFIGLLHSQEAQIELPDKLEPLRDKITQHGESMQILLRRINVEQLVTGRLGLLLDLPANPDPAQPLPYIALYVAESCINWDDGQMNEGESSLNMVVLDESGPVRDGFTWHDVSKHRVLELAPTVSGDVVTYGKYRQGVFRGDGGPAEYVESDMKEPSIRGQTLDKIPFTFVNTTDLVATPDKPPLIGLARGCLTVYRGEADYRQNLFMQGQDTFVIIGDLKTQSKDLNELASASADTAIRTGAGSLIHLEAGPGADAKYAGVGAEGLSEQRTALENDRKRAEAKAGALADDNASAAASGEALRTRVAARTASLNQIAKTGAAALEYLLKIAAEWYGADPEKVKVTPNLEFADFQLTGDNLQKIMAAKIAGAPLSKESIHRLMAQGGLTEMDFDTEQKLLDEEAANNVPPPGTTAGGNPVPPVDPNAPPTNPNAPPPKQPAPKA